MKHVVIYEHKPNKDGSGAWSACVPDLPGCTSGCTSGGDTHAECEAKIREAIAAGTAAVTRGARRRSLVSPYLFTGSELTT